MLIFVTKMTLLEKNKICRTFRAVGHLGTLHTILWGVQSISSHLPERERKKKHSQPLQAK